MRPVAPAACSAAVGCLLDEKGLEAPWTTAPTERTLRCCPLRRVRKAHFVS